MHNHENFILKLRNGDDRQMAMSMKYFEKFLCRNKLTFYNNVWIYIVFFLTILAIFTVLPVNAQTVADTFVGPLTEMANQNDQQRTLTQLVDIENSVKAIRSRQNDLKQLIKRAKSEEEQADLQGQLNQLETQAKNLRALFNQAAAGGLDLNQLDETVATDERPFKWQDELLLIIKPLFAEMRRMTETPRLTENLRQEQLLLDQHIQMLNSAVANITKLQTEKQDNQDKLSPNIAQNLKKLNDEWQARLQDLERQKDIINLQLRELQERRGSLYEQLQIATKNFLLGRGLVLLIAVATLVITLLIFQRGMNVLLAYREKQGKRRKSTKLRLFIMIYRLCIVIFSILMFLMVLYIAGDMVLLGLSVIVLFALLLSFRNYLPRYMNETRMLLNLGSVRENERLIYQGIPWKVRSIGFYSRLVNPALDNGQLRLPLSELESLFSRAQTRDEVWFPCMPGDYILFNQTTFAKVERQTPEFVTLLISSSHQYVPTADFFKSHPRNLSHGFFLSNTVTFAHHMAPQLDQIVNLMQEAIVKAYQTQPFAEGIVSVVVEFRAIQLVGLEVIVMTDCQGEIAVYYGKISRVTQNTVLATAIQYGWQLAAPSYQTPLS